MKDSVNNKNALRSSNSTGAMFPLDGQPTFNRIVHSGNVTIDVMNGDDYGGNAILQRDGKIVVAGASYPPGWGNRDFSLVRLNADGTLDQSFGGDGKVTFDIAYEDAVSAVALQRNGKIVLSGYAWAPYDQSSDFVLMRLNVDGSLDTGFSGDGQAVFDFAGSSDRCYCLQLQADGKIIAAGYGEDFFRTAQGFALLRLNPDGTLDPSFGENGKAILNISKQDEVSDVVLQPDGKIVVTGTSSIGKSKDFGVLRLNTDGSLDTSFSGDGKASFDFGGSDDYASSVILQPDGKIIVAGTSVFDIFYDRCSLLRLNADGTLDKSFSADGKATFLIQGRTGGMALQADGKILVTGSVGESWHEDTTVLRLNSDGTLDKTFSGDGRAIFDFGDLDETFSVLLQPDGKILLSGSRTDDATGRSDMNLVRLNADGSLDTTFGALTGSGKSTLGGSVNTSEGAAPVVLDGNAAVYDRELAALNLGQGNYDGSSIQLVRAGGANAQDMFSALGHLSFRDGNAVLSGIAVGQVSNAAGQLSISFNANATQSRVNEVLHSVGYANSSDAPPSKLVLNWIFRDGIGADALSVTDTTTVRIQNVNDAPTGSVTLTGVAEQGQTLSADTRALADADGLGRFGYQWLRGGALIAAATKSSYTLTQADVGQVIAVRVLYTDHQGTAEKITSAASAPVLNTNDLPTGKVTIAGKAEVGHMLEVISKIGDPDGLGTLHYQWQRGNSDIAGATFSIYQLTDADAGLAISVKVSYLDRLGTQESLSSASTAPIAFGPDQLWGDVSGRATNDVLHGGPGDSKLSGKGGNDELYGGTGNDELYGGEGGDILDGGAGKDVLVGGAGQDKFRFSGPLGSAGVDTIKDFNAIDDRLEFHQAVFTQLGAVGQVNTEAFVQGNKALDASDRLVYNQATGQLFYDDDGTGAHAAVLIARLGAGTSLKASDLFVF